MRVSDRGANGGHLKQADSELLGVADAAVYLNTSERHVRRLQFPPRRFHPSGWAVGELDGGRGLHGTGRWSPTGILTAERTTPSLQPHNRDPSGDANPNISAGLSIISLLTSASDSPR